VDDVAEGGEADDEELQGKFSVLRSQFSVPKPITDN
jgi:hypothetical protein